MTTEPESTELERIVRDVAGWMPTDDETGDCAYCGARQPPRGGVAPDPHGTDCPWAAARRWADTHLR